WKWTSMRWFACLLPSSVSNRLTPLISKHESDEHEGWSKREGVPVFSGSRWSARSGGAPAPANKEPENATQRGVHGSDRDDSRQSSDAKILRSGFMNGGPTQTPRQEEKHYAWHQ